MAAISFQQNIVRVVHLEVVQGGPLNTLIPNTCLQQPMSGKPGLPPGSSILDREPGGSSLAGKVTFFQAYGKNACVLPCMEMHVCQDPAGGCGQEGQNKGGPSLARLAGKVTFCHLLENVQHSPQIHEWILLDVLSGGIVG